MACPPLHLTSIFPAPGIALQRGLSFNPHHTPFPPPNLFSTALLPCWCAASAPLGGCICTRAQAMPLHRSAFDQAKTLNNFLAQISRGMREAQRGRSPLHKMVVRFWAHSAYPFSLQPSGQARKLSTGVFSPLILNSNSSKSHPPLDL